MRRLVRHAPEQEALRAGHALVADDDQIRSLLLGDVEDRVGGIALPGVGLDLPASLLDLLARVPQRGVHVLPLLDQPLQAVRPLPSLLAEALASNRPRRSPPLGT